MTLDQNNKLRMFSTTYTVLSNYSSLFEGSAVLQSKISLLGDNMTDLEKERQQQELATSGLTLSKDNLRSELEILILRISAALVAFATGVSDANLKKKARYTPSRLRRASDLELCDIAVNMLKLATPLIAELGVYFITQEELDLTDLKVTGFKEAIPQNRVATGTRKASTANINDLIRKTNRLLKEEIDALIQPFQFIQPEFYQQYKNARIIVDYTGRGKTPKPEEETTETDITMQ